MGCRNMDAETACKMLSNGGFEIAVRRRLPDGKGTQIRTVSGEVVNVYDTGRFVINGQHNDAVLEMFGKQRKVPQQNQLPMDFASPG
jgi:predicted nucleotide-binding protein